MEYSYIRDGSSVFKSFRQWPTEQYGSACNIANLGSGFLHTLHCVLLRFAIFVFVVHIVFVCPIIQPIEKIIPI